MRGKGFKPSHWLKPVPLGQIEERPMGAEVKCRVIFGGQTCEGKALLETNEIIFRGDVFKLKILLKEIKKLKASKDELRILFPKGEAIFVLGARTAKWAQRILNPKSVIEKIGVRNGAKAVVIDVDDEEFLEKLRGVATISDRLGRACEMIFFGAEAAEDLKRVPSLMRAMASDGALWIIYPKGVQVIREIDVLMAGRKAGLKDIKVVGFSGTHTALKFVIPVSER
jgi:hypothetical protein